MLLSYLPVAVSNRWHSSASRYIASISAFVFTCYSMVSTVLFLSLIRIRDLRFTLIQVDLI